MDALACYWQIKFEKAIYHEDPLNIRCNSYSLWQLNLTDGLTPLMPVAYKGIYDTYAQEE